MACGEQSGSGIACPVFETEVRSGVDDFSGWCLDCHLTAQYLVGALIDGSFYLVEIGSVHAHTGVGNVARDRFLFGREMVIPGVGANSDGDDQEPSDNQDGEVKSVIEGQIQ